jgi:glycosyltransferase involved in cell wall biosynthesis
MMGNGIDTNQQALNNSPLRIAFVQSDDARSVRSWSGTLLFSKEAIGRHVGTVIDLTPAPINLLPYRVMRKALGMVSTKRYSFYHDPALARRYGRYFSRLLAREPHDLVFSPGGANIIPYLETDAPIIYYSDATWRRVIDYYTDFSNVIARSARGGEMLERMTLERSSIILYPSRWAADSAIDDYGTDPAKVNVTWLGANLMTPPSRESVLPRAMGETIRLLMVGVSWEIKGGAIALETLERLLEMGHDARLTVVGCRAPEGVSHPRMEVIPFLDKQVPEERERFERLWREADFFLLPTRFEAAGLVFCEASAYALPAIATRTGGVPSLVREGRNGITLPHEARGDAYAEAIAGLAADPGRYAALCGASRDEFETRLNWDAWGGRLAAIIRERFPALGERLPAAE